ncbi:MAG: helix-hairpin-helix domain-containing protein [Alistipes sp.]
MAEFFNARERRGVLWLLPLVGLFVVGVLLAERRSAEVLAEADEEQMGCVVDSVERFAFDPNTVTYAELRRLGFSKTQALSLLNYRAAGKVFDIPEEIAGIYGMTDSLYLLLETFIHISPQYAARPKYLSHAWSSDRPTPSTPRPFRVDTVTVGYLKQIGFSTRWAEMFVSIERDRGFRNMAEIYECKYIRDSIARFLEPYLIFPEHVDRFVTLLELNLADSVALRSVRGIGEKTVTRILNYRQRLGGFYRVEQLSEVMGVTEENFELILQQISCDSCKIQKIDVNFASPKELSRHPYVSPKILRKLLKQRQQRELRGGWSTVEEMVKEHILTNVDAARLRPYLKFGTPR